MAGRARYRVYWTFYVARDGRDHLVLLYQRRESNPRGGVSCVERRLSLAFRRPYGTHIKHGLAFPAMNRWADLRSPPGRADTEPWEQQGVEIAGSIGPERAKGKI